MSEHIVTPQADEHTHSGVHDPNVMHTPEEVRREMRVYLYVFGGLMVLTAATVGACYGLRLPVHYAIMIALAIAVCKGFLVAGFFMHLLTEKKVVYGVLALTIFFFAILLWAPWQHHYDYFGR